MTPDVEIEIKTTVRLDLATAAKWFAALDDDTQAQFFVEVCKAAREWPAGKGVNLGPSYQWYLIGSHLRNCACSSDDAREMVRSMHEGLTTGTH